MPQRDIRLINGNYKLGQQISSNSLLTNYTALDRNTNDVVGLSLIELPQHVQQESIPRFLQAFENRQRVDSPHVLKLYQCGSEGNRIYFVTDPPRGVTLQYVFDHENIELTRALDICRQVALGLSALHNQHIAGIDLRPRFITVDVTEATDRVQIDDIGLRSLLRSLRATGTGVYDDLTAIDPLYAAPEYLNAQAIGPWSDIYAVGTLLFMLISGRLPFVGNTESETANLQCNSPVPNLHLYTHEATPVLQELINRAMAKAPENRFSDAARLLKAIESVLKQPHITPSSQTLATQAITSIKNVGTETATSSPDGEQSHSMQMLANTPWHIPLPTPLGIYAFLTLAQSSETGSKKVRLVVTQKTTIIGRADPKRGVQPDIDLTQFDPDMTVSRQHACLRFEDTFFSLEDLKSRNKTRINGHILPPLTAEPIQHGAILSLGSVRISFEVPGMDETTQTNYEVEEQDNTIS